MRLLNKIYAKMFGYFWARCRRCGRMFGGHESRGTIIDHDSPDQASAWLTCCLPDEQANRFDRRSLASK